MTVQSRQPPADPQERTAAGRALRSVVPRVSHAELPPPEHDPVDLLLSQDEGRIPQLVPVRYGRMLASELAFLRGSALVMAADLAGTPRTGLEVQLCGDAHLSNFGLFATPERREVFDLNDFDETLRGPWEWDVKRLAASLAVAAAARGAGIRARRRIVESAVAAYRSAMQEFAGMGHLAVWYSALDTARIAKRLRPVASRDQQRRLASADAKARRRDSARALTKLTYRVSGEPRIVADPPLVVPLADLVPGRERSAVLDGVTGVIEGYKESLAPDRAAVLAGYRVCDVARKAVGVGSVGTRSWIVLMIGRDPGDALFMQAKEAQPSVLGRFLAAAPQPHQGRRVVLGQRAIQAAGDAFLGWYSMDEDGTPADYYVRQLWDGKLSVPVESLTPAELGWYGEFCAWTLARAHARTGDRFAISGYLGSGASFDHALADFAELALDRNSAGHRALAEAVKAGRVTAAEG